MEISEPTSLQIPGLTDVEHRKMLRQAVDIGIIIFFKQFIPLFWFRYWNTRFRVGPVVWVFLLLFTSASASVLKFEYMLECAQDSSGCDQSPGTYTSFDLAINTAAPIVFAIYSGHLARKSRERLGINRKTAITLLSER